MKTSGTAGHASIANRAGTFLYLIGAVCLLLVLFLLNTAERMGYREPPALDCLPGLEADVEVVWDESGTWHVRGESWEDVLRAQGWIHARERMWQMELGRLAGRGRLSELFGSLALPADRVMRTLGLHRAAQKQVGDLPDYARRVLQAYADGVSAWLASESCRLPLELVLLGWEPEPWSIEDSALQFGLVGLTLSSNWAQEAVRASLEARFSAEEVALLLPYPDEGPFIADGNASNEIEGSDTGPDIQRAWRQWALMAGGISALREFLGVPEGGVGSNAWVVSGDRTKSGKPLLANDPHLGVQIPSLWISQGLHIPGRDLTGVSIPGVPSVIIGRTNAFAWGFTNTMADNQDLYIERPVEGDPDRYWFRERQIPFEVRSEVIEVRRAQPETLTIRSTLHGPVISDVLVRMLHGAEEVVSAIENDGSGESAPVSGQNVEDWVEDSPPITLRWVTLEDGGELTSLARILEARDWYDVRELFTTFLSPGQNVVYADTTGLIAWQFTGAIPVRRGWDGTRPVPGWTGEYEWDGYVPFDELPRLEDPAPGFIVSANQPPKRPGTEPFLGRWWIPPYRARAIADRLTDFSDHTLETFEDIQRDVRSLAALKVVDVLTTLPAGGERTGQALSALREWDGRMSRRGPGVLYEMFIARFFEEVLLDELGAQGLRDYRVLLEFYEGRIPVILRLLDTPSAPWWDDIGSEEVEGPSAIVERIWERVWQEATGQFGPDPNSWEWGRLHQLVLRHPLARFWPLTSLMNRGPIGLPGDNDTIFNTGSSYNDPYRITVSSSWRHIVDLSAPVSARSILPVGNAGHVLSPHYADLLDDWAEGRTRPSATTWDEALAGAVRTMLLRPPP